MGGSGSLPRADSGGLGVIGLKIRHFANDIHDSSGLGGESIMKVIHEKF